MNTRISSGPVMLIGAAACWGVGTVITKEALGGFAALTLLVVQLVSSIAILLVLARVLGIRPTYRPGIGRLTALGVLNPGLAYTLGLLGLTRTSASLSVLLWALEPAFIFVLAHLFLGDRTTRWSQLALACALSGVVLVVYQPGAGGDALGIALLVAGVTTCAAYTVISRHLLADSESVSVVVGQQLVALVFAAAALVAVQTLDGDALRADGSTTAWAWAVASGGLYYGIAFWLYLGGLRLTTASVAGSYLALIPVFGLAAAAALGDRLTLAQWAGALLVVAGVAGVIRSDRRRTTGRRPSPTVRERREARTLAAWRNLMER
jgi:drug/metabolite transporter (DMT)-like permease